MALSRRECLRLGIGSASVMACGNRLPGFLAQAAPAVTESSRPERILVVVELEGGNDGLNTIVPYADDVYHRSRPTLGIAQEDTLRIDDHVGYHSALRGLAELQQRDQCAIVQSVGYPNPTRSHFRSMATWHAGQLGATLSSQGWLSRYLDATVPVGVLDSPAMHVDSGKLSQALCGGRLLIPTMENIKKTERRLGAPAGANPIEHLSRLDGILAEPRGAADSDLRFIQQSSLMSYASSRRLRDLIKSVPESEATRYPATGLAERLKAIGHLVKAGLSTQVYTTRLGGFDTHVDQFFAHVALLRELGDALRAFMNDLESSQLAQHVLVLVFSEFGRRLRENASEGTDHGTAGPVFLIGPAVQAGLHGPYPNLTDLNDQDPKHAIDFRRIYATLLEKWLGTDAAQVLGSHFPTLDVL